MRLGTVLNLELFRARSVRFPSWSLNTHHVEEAQLIKIADLVFVSKALCLQLLSFPN
jgi:hypothetical protein